MRKSFLRKASIVLLSATMLMATACNKEIEVKYDYNVNDYVQLGKYEDIAVTVDKTSIENQLVDDKIAEDIENNTTYSEVSRGAVDGDKILVTYVATSSGSQSTGLSNTDGVTMILGKDKLGLDIEELDEALYGMKAGETKVMVIDLPETYSNTVYAGTKVVFELTVQTVSQPNVPMLTNAYVKETFGYDTIEEYRASVKDSLASTIDSKVDDEIQKQVLSTLQDTCKVSGYPDTLLSTLRDRYDQSVGFYADFTNQSKEEYCQQLYGMSYDDFIKKSAAQQLIMEAIVKDQKFSMREYDYKGDLDAAILAAAILLAVLVNLVVRALPSKYTEFDLSEAKMYTLGDSSVQLAQSLQQDVTIYYLCETGSEDAIITKLLDRYASESSHIKWETKDLAVYPTFAAQYGVQSAENGSLILVSGEKSAVLAASDLYDYDYLLHTCAD